MSMGTRVGKIAEVTARPETPHISATRRCGGRTEDPLPREAHYEKCLHAVSQPLTYRSEQVHGESHNGGFSPPPKQFEHYGKL